MKFIRFFNNLSSNDVAIAGGKGANLGEMAKIGVEIPPGFVVLSDAFEHFLNEAELKVEIDAALDTVKNKEIHKVESVSEYIQAIILNAEIPKDISFDVADSYGKLGAKWVAIRSSASAEDSASAAWAGQLESYLNVSENDVLMKIKRCWASLFTPRAIFYRFDKKLHKQPISVAVVVQKMVESEVSGIAFSVHPVTQDYNQLIIEAGYGLGEAIVSGQITPDSYVVKKREREILEVHIEKQDRMLTKNTGNGNEWIILPPNKQGSQKLTEKQILALSDIIVQIESHFGFPCDVEWAYENGKFNITQSRPITTLIKTENIKEKKSFLQKAYKTKWIKWLERPYSPFIASLTFPGIGKKYYEKVGLGSFDNDVLFQNNTIYYSEGSFQKNMDRIGNFLNNNTIFSISSKLQKIHAKNLCEFKQILRSNETLLVKLSLIMEMSRSYLPFLWITLPLEEYFTKKIHSEFPKYVNGDINNFIASASIPKKRAVHEKIEDDLRRGLPVEKIHNKYAWAKCRDGFTDFYTLEEICEMRLHLKKLSKKERIRIPKLAKSLADELQELVFFRTDRTDKFYEFLAIVRPIFKEVADLIGVDFMELASYDASSILRGTAKKYGDNFSYLFLGGKEILQQGSIIDFDNTNNCEIKGKTAYGGVVTGIAKIVKHSSEVGKVDKGDILVSQMTLPSFILAMNKAAAFVTDEGSITCHAAIISREMRKPCIIGTKNATQELKDGDLIEVDADKGVVRKIC